MTDDQTRDEILEALLSATSSSHAATAFEQTTLPENLLTIVDSFGFVQLVAALEERLGIELDLDGVELGDLVVSASLIDFLQSQMQASTTLDR
jgi:acyl carrier protein